MSTDEARLDTRLLAAYLQGEVTSSEARAIEVQRRDDAGVRRRLDDLAQIQEALSAPVPELEELDLVAGVQRALAAPPPKPRGRGVVWGLAAAAAAATLPLALHDFSSRPAGDSEFRAKSNAGSLDPAGRWSGIQVQRVSETGTPARVDDGFRVQDGLLFSYTNLGPEPFDHLLIFAVDALGKVYWFYPAYERAGETPTAVPIEKGRSEAPLPDLIHHDFSPGPLAIYGLFTREPLAVSKVEAWLGARGNRIASGKPLPNTNLHVLTLQVAR